MSQLILFGESDPERRTTIFERLRPFTPRVLESDLPPEVEDALNRTLQGERPASEGQ